MSDERKIIVGPGTGVRPKGKFGAYGNSNNGKLRLNGGFDGCPTIDFTRIPQDKWVKIFGQQSLLPWQRKLLEEGGTLD